MNDSRTTISIITPVYLGNKYLEKLFACIRENARNCQEECTIQWILVNDSPQEPIVYHPAWVEGFQVSVLDNPRNMGIQHSRVNGLKAAVGEYIIFLDQDDFLSSDAVLHRFRARGNYDVIVSNGFDENPLNHGPIYKSKNHLEMVTQEKYYYQIGCMIVSPGQCMLRKAAIPQEWGEHFVTINGADDLLLWLFMLRKGCSFGTDSHCTYTHVASGSNVSADFRKMVASSQEALDIMEKTMGVTPQQKKDFHKRFQMRQMYEGKGPVRKVLAYLRYPDIALAVLKTKGLFSK